jgi:hypothetical protein
MHLHMLDSPPYKELQVLAGLVQKVMVSLIQTLHHLCVLHVNMAKATKEILQLPSLINYPQQKVLSLRII